VGLALLFSYPGRWSFVVTSDQGRLRFSILIALLMKVQVIIPFSLGSGKLPINGTKSHTKRMIYGQKITISGRV
jgi:hypothetical protein